jgi:hypothetical protein
MPPPARYDRLLGLAHALLAVLLGCDPYFVCAPADERHVEDLPARLSETGLYAASGELAEGVRAFRPRFELWSDGASKRRWVWLPPGAQIDTSDPGDWRSPQGAKFWEEFTRDGVRIETRLIEKVRPKQEDRRALSYVWRDARRARCRRRSMPCWPGHVSGAWLSGARAVARPPGRQRARAQNVPGHVSGHVPGARAPRRNWPCRHVYPRLRATRRRPCRFCVAVSERSTARLSDTCRTHPSQLPAHTVSSQSAPILRPGLPSGLKRAHRGDDWTAKRAQTRSPGRRGEA